jgi:hypothetical protein
VLDGYADTSGTPQAKVESYAGMTRWWGTGKIQHVINPDMPWNEEIRATWARYERLSASPRTVSLMHPLVSEVDVRAVLPTIRVPTLVIQHADNSYMPPAKGEYIAEHIPDANTLSCRAATGRTSLNHGARPSRRSPNSSPASRQLWPMIGFWRRCFSPISWIQRGGPPRSATVTGMPYLTRTTPSSGRNSHGSGAAR